MTSIPVAYDALIGTREEIIRILGRTLNAQEKEFLISVKLGEPKWDSLGVRGLDRLPALQWKRRNIHSLTKEKHLELLEKLKSKLGSL